MKKLLFINLLGLLLISACVSRDSVFSTLKGNSGLIAYLGTDGNVYVSDQGGSHLSQLTKDAVKSNSDFILYQLPTWSLDGNQLAFIQVSSSAGKPASKIFVSDIAQDNTREIYTSENEHPFYLLWSPDDSNVSFLSTAVADGLILLQYVPAQGGDRTIIDTGSPYYWSWAPDGKTMITHSGGSQNSTTPEHLAFIQIQDSEILENGLDATPASFQSPAWSPDGSLIALARLQDGAKEIILTDSHGAYEKTVGSFKEYTAFSWSSNGKKIAYIDGEITPLNAGVMGKLNVMDLETSQIMTTEADQVFAFFWSPDGEKLVYFVPAIANSGNSSADEQVLYLQTFTFDAETGESRELFTYRPTPEFVSILPYFDQYHQSNTIWSPDSQSLVLSFINQEGNPSLAIVNLAGEEPTTKLFGEGVLAFWSWK
jgi:Tol biopolymer transport system component